MWSVLWWQSTGDMCRLAALHSCDRCGPHEGFVFSLIGVVDVLLVHVYSLYSSRYPSASWSDGPAKLLPAPACDTMMHISGTINISRCGSR